MAPPAYARGMRWATLKKRLRGHLVMPGDPRFDELATPRNLRYAALMPQAIALCADADDVAAAVRWARDTGTPFAIRGGGHNYIDASSSRGLVISTRAMTRASTHESILDVQAGVRNADLAKLLPQGGQGAYLLPGGTCPQVGVAGLTLGGGIGPNAPWAGLTTDRLREATMVTADGDIVTANAHRNADLFWGLRGAAGGNFGVVTDLTYDMVDIPVTRATTFVLTYDAASAAQAAIAWQAIRAANVRDLGGSWLASQNASGFTSRVKAQVLLDEDDARSLMAPLLALPAISTEVIERTWWDTYAWHATPVSPSNTFWDRSLFAKDDLSPDVANQVIEVVRRFPHVNGGYGAFVIAGWVGGRVNDMPAQRTAYVHRDAQALLEFGSGWPSTPGPTVWPTPVPPRIRDWMNELWDMIHPHTTGRSYQNFPDPGLTDWAHAYYGANLRRLSKIKSAWDPDNVFTYSQGVPSSA